jgi:hypothetical protein
VAYHRIGMVENCRILGLEDMSDERRIELGIGVPEKKPKNDDKKDMDDVKQDDESK